MGSSSTAVSFDWLCVEAVPTLTEDNQLPCVLQVASRRTEKEPEESSSVQNFRNGPKLLTVGIHATGLKDVSTDCHRPVPMGI